MSVSGANVVPETVTITVKEYEYLIGRDYCLDCLEAHGVDNWSGYGEAMDEWRKGPFEDN